MITKDTCYKIWTCWNEIEKANGLIDGLNKAVKETGEATLKNGFGERNSLKLGVPSGNESHYIYNVPVDLSVKIILAHIDEQERKLRELEAICLIELKGKPL